MRWRRRPETQHPGVNKSYSTTRDDFAQAVAAVAELGHVLARGPDTARCK